ncbi:MAG: anthrax toxin-like adenylyl cyclase domain-containing protein [Nitrospirota bacterium]
MSRTKNISHIIISLVFFLSIIIPSTAYSGNIDLDAVVTSLDDFERDAEQADKKARAVLGQVGSSTLAQLMKTVEKLEEEFKVWDENLDVQATQTIDLEKERNRLKQWVEIWTENINVTEIAELKQGIGDALAIAHKEGRDIRQIAKIYDLTKKVIRTADFIVPENSVFDRIQRLNLKTDDRPSTQLMVSYFELFQMGFAIEEFEAHARAEHQKYRVNLYKRAAVAFIRALISLNDPVPECTKDNIKPEQYTYKGKIVQMAGCPDPGVEHLKSYYKAVQRIQSADSDALSAEVEDLIAEQQLIADVASIIPLLGDGIDLYAAWSGEDLAGYCLTPFERVLMGAFSFIPMVGPSVLDFAAKKSKRVATAVETLSNYFNATIDFAKYHGKEISKAYVEMGEELTGIIAKSRYVDIDILIKLRKYLDDLANSDVFRHALTNEQQAELIMQRTLRQAKEDARWIKDLPQELQERATAESAERMAKNLGRIQGPYAERFKLTNMVPEHVEALEKLVKEKGDWVLMYRSVNPDATELIIQNYATKGMNVKGKSADWGAHAGFIPSEQKLSKLGNPNRAGGIDKAAIEEFHEKVRKCLKANPPCAFEAALKWKHKGKEMPVHVVVDSKTGQEVTAIFDESTGKYIDRRGNVMNVDGTNARDVMVLSDSNGNPLTADYDFLGFGKKSDIEAPRFDRDKGYIADWEEEMLDASNEAIREGGGYLGGNISHHGAEQWYPFSPGAMEVDDVVTVFDPEAGFRIIPRCDADCMRHWCRTERQCNPLSVCEPPNTTKCFPPDPNRLLKDYMHDKRLGGYNVGPNSKWGWGGYDVTGGWSFAEYMMSVMEKRVPTMESLFRKSVRQGAGRRVVAKRAAQEGRAIDEEYFEMDADVIKEAIPACRERPRQEQEQPQQSTNNE